MPPLTPRPGASAQHRLRGLHAPAGHPAAAATAALACQARRAGAAVTRPAWAQPGTAGAAGGTTGVALTGSPALLRTSWKPQSRGPPACHPGPAPPISPEGKSWANKEPGSGGRANAELRKANTGPRSAGPLPCRTALGCWVAFPAAVTAPLGAGGMTWPSPLPPPSGRSLRVSRGGGGGQPWENRRGLSPQGARLPGLGAAPTPALSFSGDRVCAPAGGCWEGQANLGLAPLLGHILAGDSEQV